MEGEPFYQCVAGVLRELPAAGPAQFARRDGFAASPKWMQKIGRFQRYIQIRYIFLFYP